MSCILFFITSSKLLFYSLHRTATEIRKAPIGTTIRFFSTAFNADRSLGKILRLLIDFLITLLSDSMAFVV